MPINWGGLARVVADGRRGAMEGEETRRQRELAARRQQQDEDEQAFREWAMREQMRLAAEEREHRRTRETAMDQRYNAEQQADALRQGFEGAPESVVSQLMAGYGMMQGGTGAASALAKPAQRTSPYRGKVAGVDIEAEDMGGPQYATVGGRVMRLDRQRGANQKARDQYHDLAAQDARDTRIDERGEARDRRTDARAEARDARTEARQMRLLQARERDGTPTFLLPDAVGNMAATLTGKPKTDDDGDHVDRDNDGQPDTISATEAASMASEKIKAAKRAAAAREYQMAGDAYKAAIKQAGTDAAKVEEIKQAYLAARAAIEKRYGSLQ